MAGQPIHSARAKPVLERRMARQLASDVELLRKGGNLLLRLVDLIETTVDVAAEEPEPVDSRVGAYKRFVDLIETTIDVAAEEPEPDDPLVDGGPWRKSQLQALIAAGRAEEAGTTADSA